MATYFWVGGAGTWNSTTTTNWSLTSGGAGSAGVPTATDTATFDANSGSGNVSIASTATCSICNFGAANLFYNLAANHSTGFTTINLSDGSFSGNGFALTTSSTINHTGGTIGIFPSLSIVALNSTGTTARTLDFSLTSTVALSGSTPLTLSGSNLTLTAPTTISCSFTGPTLSITGNYTFKALSFTSTATTSTHTLSISSGNILTLSSLTFASKSFAGVSSVVIGPGNITITGAFTVPAPTTIGNSRYFFRTNSLGTPVTITAATTTLTDVDFRDITAAGAASWTGTRLGDAGGNTVITFPASKTVYWNLAGSQNYSATGWATTQTGTPAAANFPLPQDTAVFTDTAPVAGSTITLNIAYNIGTLNFSSRTNTLTFATGTISPQIIGSITLSSAIALTGTGTLVFSGRGVTQTITSAGVSWPQIFTINAISSTIVLGDALTKSSAGQYTTISNGTLNLAGYTFTTGGFQTGSGTKNITFNGGTLTCSGSTAGVAGAPFLNGAPTGFTTTAGTGTGIISMTAAASKTFDGGGSTYNCTLNQGGAGTLAILGANTFNNITNTVQPATISFFRGTTNTFANFNLNGTAGNLITINSSASGAQFTIAFTGSPYVSCDYLSIKDSNAI